jgi:hypothetical protein
MGAKMSLKEHQDGAQMTIRFMDRDTQNVVAHFR